MLTHITISYWIVNARPGVHDEGRLRALSAPYCLTLNPGPGDTIYAEGHASVTLQDDGAVTIRATTRTEGAWHHNVHVTTHGEPDPEANDSTLHVLLAEHLSLLDETFQDRLLPNGQLRPGTPRWRLYLRTTESPWRWAPVHATKLPDDWWDAMAQDSRLFPPAITVATPWQRYPEFASTPVPAQEA